MVVVVTMREGSRGSGPRLDWENLRFARLRAASSLGKEGERVDGRGEESGGYARQERVWKIAEKLPVCSEVEGDDEGGIEIEGVLRRKRRE